MKIKDYMMCTKDRKRKKHGKLVLAVLTAALLLYIPVCSLSDSIHSGVNKVYSTMMGRTIIVQEQDDLDYETLQKKFQGDKRVTGIYQYVYQIPVTADNFIKDADTLGSTVQAYDECMEEYVCEGKKSNLADDEILIPQYLYGYGEEKNYAPGDEYIGKTVKLTLENSYLGTQTTETFQIVGTYDNIYGFSGDMNFLVNTKKAVELYEFGNEGVEIVKQQMMEESGNYDESAYAGFENVYYYGIFLADREYLQEIAQECGGSPQIYETDASLAKIFDSVRVFAGKISAALLAVCAVLIVLSVLHEMEERRWESAMKLAFGYERRQLVVITFLEYVRLAFCGYFIAMGVSIVLKFFVNFIISSFMAAEYQWIHLRVSGDIAAIGMVVVIFLAVISIPICAGNLKHLRIADTLKLEE